MPNYIRNKLTITGNQTHVEEVFEQIKGLDEYDNPVPLSLSSIIVPEFIDSRKCREDTWGVNGECYYFKEEEELNKKRGTTDPIYFITSWKAPLKAIETLSISFPEVNITIDYAIEGIITTPHEQEPCGKMVYHDGMIIGMYNPIDDYHLVEHHFVCWPEEVKDYKVFVDGDKQHFLKNEDLEYFLKKCRNEKTNPVLLTPEEFFKKSF